eukprot:TRINITY_DN33906_c0_g1_i1.p1 TRINITY_DN33906_c0_g1~~TRINITY_DN33906_c0_g1_i1.p1  ORF type:complete len:381 (+),score=25.78 TRINITY_DN33906_c0_g1_i1:86-1144(+)
MVVGAFLVVFVSLRYFAASEDLSLCGSSSTSAHPLVQGQHVTDHGAPQVVFSTDRNGFDGLLVSMISLTLNLVRPGRCHIHIIVSKDDMVAARNLVRLFSEEVSTMTSIPNVTLHNMKHSVSRKILGNAYLGWRRKDVLTPHLASMFYLHLYFPTLPRIIWLDADAIVQGDIGELFNSRLKHAFAAAIWQSWENGRVKYVTYGDLRQTFLNEMPSSYHRFLPNFTASRFAFNAGVAVFDLKKWRQSSFTQLLQDLTLKFDGFQYVQFPLQVVFHNGFDVLDWRWNVQQLGMNCGIPLQCIREARILHFSGPNKPWNYHLAKPESARCWNHLVQGYAPRRYWARFKVGWTKVT